MLREGEVRIPAGCAISGIIAKDGEKFNGEDIIKSISVMRDRSNGLGGGFAAYGIYPEFKDYYAFHVFYDSTKAKEDCEAYINKYFETVSMSKMPTRQMKEITDEPLIWRYFVRPLQYTLFQKQVAEDEFVFQSVMFINVNIDGAFVFSSGKDMGAFKAVGFPEDVGEYYRLEEYEGYCWTAHGRYPTNTPGWWGGAHPFAMLDCSVVHNGEISSYDANRRYIEMMGYNCTLQTDTEAITYIIDYLVRQQGMTYEDAASVMAAPFWSTIESMPKAQREKMTYLRNAFASMLITGPFSILVGFTGGLMALNDRLKLRSMVIGERKNKVYIASEEAAIRVIQPDLDNIWAPKGGEPVVIRVNGGAL
ncbi:MAG TPA: glutamine amidotransferase family protein [Clostridiales bacterium]|nr:glutamine amidotransferase family protein [Clostridiales bacterium]